MIRFKSVLKLLRVNQWSKNVLLFFPLFFSSQITNYDLFISVSIAFLGFSLIASAVYVFNDLFDREEDRMHPQKKNRPIANSEISIRAAWVIISALLTIGICIFYFLFDSLYVFGLILLYLLLNLLYTIKLKNIVLVDITIISLGFVIRLFIGGEIGMVELSQWIILMTFLLAFFLSLGKRREETLFYNSTNVKVRKNIAGYTLDFVNSSMTITASVVIVSYIMFTMSDTQNHFSSFSKYSYLTTFFVLLGILRYYYLITVKKVSGGPTQILFRDFFLVFIITGWFTTYALLIY